MKLATDKVCFKIRLATLLRRVNFAGQSSCKREHLKPINCALAAPQGPLFPSVVSEKLRTFVFYSSFSRFRAVVMFVIISIRCTLHVLLLGNLANGTYL